MAFVTGVAELGNVSRWRRCNVDFESIPFILLALHIGIRRRGEVNEEGEAVRGVSSSTTLGLLPSYWANTVPRCLSIALKVENVHPRQPQHLDEAK